MIEAILVIVVIAVVGLFLKKPLKGLAYGARAKMEDNLPLVAKMDRAIGELEGKRVNIGRNLKQLYKAKAIVTQQRMDAQGDENRKAFYEKRKATEDKLNGQADKVLNVVSKIDDNLQSLKAERSYVGAMESIKGFDGIDIDTEMTELFAEIEAVEKVMDVM